VFIVAKTGIYAINATTLLLDVARGAAISVCATLAARWLMSIATSRWVVALLIAWIAVPALAIAYVWAAFPFDIIHQPWCANMLHIILSAGRLAPIALVIVACVPPPPLDAVAYHCLRLTTTGRGKYFFLRWWSAGPGRCWLVTSALLFPLAFGEFEIGSRLNTGSWAVRLFDAQAGGQFLSTTLMQAAPGVIVQLAMLALAWWLLKGRGMIGAPHPPLTNPLWLRIVAWLMLAGGSAALVVFPLTTLVVQASSGFAVALAQAGNLRDEIAASLLFAATTAGCAWLVSGLNTARPPASGIRRLFGAAVIIPGLCGSLVIGLIILACCQLPLLRSLANSPLPILVALVALVLPYALVLRWMSRVPSANAAWHQATLLDAGAPNHRQTARNLRWSLVGRRRWWAVVLLFMWAYCDLAASAILHPVDMTPVLVRLYNLMHYGQSTALSVQLTMTLLAPLVVIALAYLALRLPPWHRLQAIHHKSESLSDV
jgi:hypothetical protein